MTSPVPDSPTPDALTRWALENPELALWHLAKPRAERSLLEFIKLTWHVLLPRTPFVEGRLLREICRHLEAVTEGKIIRLAIAVPPGTAKSLITNVFWPAWEWGPRGLSHYRYVSTSYSEHLSIRDNGYCLKLVQSDVYQALWGGHVHLDPKLRGSVKFGLIETGWRFATSVGGTGTGERGDRIIIDDPLNAKEAVSDAALEEALQYFTEVIPSRTTDPAKSAIVLIMQRLNERDPIGHVLSSGLDYDFLCLPMEYELDHPFPSRTSLGFVDWRTEPGELLFPERFPREVVDREKHVLSSWGGEFACTPYEAPVLMADLSLRPIGEVKAGDVVVGFHRPSALKGRKHSRAVLTQSKVLDVFVTEQAPVVDLHLDSGEVVRCTPSHRWYKRRGEGIDFKYGPARVGSTLLRVCPPKLPEVDSLEDARLAGWLAGFFDGEGSVSRPRKKNPQDRTSTLISFAQGAGRNLPNCLKLEQALEKFGFGYRYYKDTRKDPKIGANFEYRQYVLNGIGLPSLQKFLHIVQPLKWRDRLVEGAFRSKFVRGREKVLRIEPAGTATVYSLKTETGNYVVWGIASSNCAGQFQQRPSPRGGGLFKRAWFKTIDEHDVRRLGASCRGWDLAGSKDGRAAFTVGALLRRAEIDGREAYVIADVFRDRISSGELRTRLLAIAARDGRGTKQSLPQDPGQAGLAQKHDLGALLDGYDVSITPESGSKEDRARPFAAQAELGNVYVVRAPWTETLLRELETFPTGTYKDQVDALSRAYAALLRLRTSSPGGAPMVVPAEGLGYDA